MKARLRSPDIATRVPKEDERAPMVGWFDPGQLFSTAIEVAVSTLFGRNADRRLLDAVAHGDLDPIDRSNEQQVWIDYVADTGDGWNSTYSVAYHLAQRELELETPAGERAPTSRGEILLFGGDEVYPTASRDAYEQRLVAPYRTALMETAAPHPDVLAIPGNHDWYDSLVAFTRLFCSDRGRWFGGWRTAQKLSYFAVKLPHDWWLIGTDFQLDSDIDDPQLDFFRRVARGMGERDRIILCLAEPHWISEARYQKFDATISQRNLRVLEEKIFNNRVEVFLAGDLHHYRRHASADGRQKITAGGGGAFLYPTHADEKEVAVLRDGYTCTKAFPDPQTSRKLAWRNLLFPLINPRFGIATALLYMLLCWAGQVDVSQFGLLQWREAIARVINVGVQSQAAVMWALLMLGGFYFFTDPKSPTFRLFGGLLHGLAHLVAAFVIGWAASYLTPHWFGWTFGTTSYFLASGAMILAAGYVVGAMIMGIYLLIAVNLFGRQAGEAFSSLHIEDYKSWLRLHITPSGALVIYPIGIKRVARKWREATPTTIDGETGALVVPNDRNATRPFLIEEPVTIGPVAVASAPPNAYPTPSIAPLIIPTR